MALLKTTIAAAILCLHVLHLSTATKAAGPAALNKTRVLLNSSTEEHLRMTRATGQCYVDLYDIINFGGSRLRIFGEVYNLQYKGFNNRASSAKVYGPCQWIFYVHNFYRDPSILTAGNYESTFRWGQLPDRLSSLRCMPPARTTAIVLFKYRNFEGPSLVLYGSVRYLYHSGFNDMASSAIITGGCWTLYEHDHYQGHQHTACRSHISVLPRDNQLSSVRLL